MIGAFFPLADRDTRLNFARLAPPQFPHPLPRASHNTITLRPPTEAARIQAARDRIKWELYNLRGDDLFESARALLREDGVVDDDARPVLSATIDELDKLRREFKGSDKDVEIMNSAVDVSLVSFMTQLVKAVPKADPAKVRVDGEWLGARTVLCVCVCGEGGGGVAR